MSSFLFEKDSIFASLGTNMKCFFLFRNLLGSSSYHFSSVVMFVVLDLISWCLIVFCFVYFSNFVVVKCPDLWEVNVLVVIKFVMFEEGMLICSEDLNLSFCFQLLIDFKWWRCIFGVIQIVAVLDSETEWMIICSAPDSLNCFQNWMLIWGGKVKRKIICYWFMHLPNQRRDNHLLCQMPWLVLVGGASKHTISLLLHLDL